MGLVRLLAASDLRIKHSRALLLQFHAVHPGLITQTTPPYDNGWTYRAVLVLDDHTIYVGVSGELHAPPVRHAQTRAQVTGRCKTTVQKVLPHDGTFNVGNHAGVASYYPGVIVLSGPVHKDMMCSWTGPETRPVAR